MSNFGIGKAVLSPTLMVFGKVLVQKMGFRHKNRKVLIVKHKKKLKIFISMSMFVDKDGTKS